MAEVGDFEPGGRACYPAGVPTTESIREAFERAYGATPDVVVRAPGRVNLIGEHTDYSGLPVLPIAIERATWIAASATDDGVVRAESTGFPGQVEMARGVQRETHGWGRYVAGVLRELGDVGGNRGAKVLIDSDLPATGGLSSSSALSVGLTAALAAAWGTPFAPEEVARLAARSERHAGVETGGMDQLVIALATAGHALRIDFLPPATRQVALPEGLAFVVAYSGQKAPKGGDVRDAYNERVVGARSAAILLAEMLGSEIDDPLTLGQVADADVVDILAEELPESVTARDVAKSAAIDVNRLTKLSHFEFDSMAKLAVRRYARHILSEAARVNDAEAALKAGDMKKFGAALNASHESLRSDFRCSTPALDKVCAAMRKAGAFGSRLTGAGFGGYALAACSPDKVQNVIDAAVAATGGPAFEVHASGGLEIL